MCDAEPSGKANNAWTEEAKNEFLLRIIMQLKPEGKGINWSSIQMPGRTVKSLQNQWTAVNKKIELLKSQQQNGEPNGPATPKKIPTGKQSLTLAPRRKRKAKKAESDDDDDVGSASARKPAARKRRGNTDTPERAAKAVKKELSEAFIKDEDEATDNELGDGEA